MIIETKTGASQMSIQAISQHLKVAEQAIVKIEEWANCFFVVVRGLGARFVSKKVKGYPKEIKYIYPTGQKIKMILVEKSSGWDMNNYWYETYVDETKRGDRFLAHEVFSKLNQLPSDARLIY